MSGLSAPLAASRPLVGVSGPAERLCRWCEQPIPARRVDALVHVSRPRMTDRRRVIGAKPGAFCRWLFELLGARQGDELVDLFPGSGGVARAWRDASRLQPAVVEDLHDAS